MTTPNDRDNGCVLIVDDEPAIRTLVKLHLERDGIVAIDACSAEEALAVFEREGSRIRLLITDLVMPRVSGRDLALSIRRLQPDLPVIYMSGFTDRVPDDGIPCLQKPLDFHRLVGHVRHLAGFVARCAART